MKKKNKRAKKPLSELTKGFVCMVGSSKDCWYRAQCILGLYEDWEENFGQDYCDLSILVHDALMDFVECGELDESYIRQFRWWENRFHDDDWLVERVKAECDILRDELGR